MEQPAHDLRPFGAAQMTPRRMVSIGIVILIHVVAIYALATGLASQLVIKGEQIIKAQIVKEKPPDLPKTPPPPPPEMKKPPPPFIPPPDINLQVEQTAPTITQVTTAITPPAPPPPKPVKAAPPAITAPASIGKAHECQSRYPPLAMRLGHSGSVLLGLTIEPNGSVSNVHVISGSGHEELDSGAVSCAQNWHYKPAMQNGKPVAVPWKTKVDYKLSGG